MKFQQRHFYLISFTKKFFIFVIFSFKTDNYRCRLEHLEHSICSFSSFVRFLLRTMWNLWEEFIKVIPSMSMLISRLFIHHHHHQHEKEKEKSEDMFSFFLQLHDDAQEICRSVHQLSIVHCHHTDSELDEYFVQDVASMKNEFFSVFLNEEERLTRSW